MPLSESLEREWGEYKTVKPKLFKLVPRIFRTYDFSEWTQLFNLAEHRYFRMPPAIESMNH